jgi:hypothetical protein
MSTEDDLKHLGQAAAALMGLAASRAKQVAEELLGSREKVQEDAKHRAGTFFEGSRYAAADVVSALRREAVVVLRDLESLEENLRRRQADAGATTADPAGPGGPDPDGGTSTKTTTTTTTTTTKRAPRAGGSKPGGSTQAAKSASSTPKTAATKKAATPQKAAGARKASGPRKSSGSSGATSGGQA